MKFIEGSMVLWLLICSSLAFAQEACEVPLIDRVGNAHYEVFAKELDDIGANRPLAEKRNAKTISTFLEKTAKTDLKKAPTLAIVAKLAQSLKKSPSIGMDMEGYWGTGATGATSIRGFCHGRALALHGLARSMGIEDRYMRKFWLLGSPGLDDGMMPWDYHVAFGVQDNKGAWHVLDIYDSTGLTGGDLPLKSWVGVFEKVNRERKAIFPVRVYVSSPYRYTLVDKSYNLEFLRYLDEQTTFWSAIKKEFKSAKLEQLVKLKNPFLEASAPSCAY